MIKPSISIRGKTTPSIKIKGKTNASIIRMYPELEDIEITPTLEDQKFKSEMYGFNEINVKGVSSYIDGDIKPEYIKEGVDILGVVGNVIELQGEEKTVVPTREQQEILPSEGKNAITTLTVEAVDNTIDENIKPEYIKEGVNILGVEGKYKGTDSSDATASADDILAGKTAYVNNEKIEGNIQEYDGSFEGNVSESVKITDASYLFYYGARRDMINELLNICKNVTNTQSMFGYNDKITTLDLSNFDTSNVTNMEGMFTGCDSLLNLNINNFNTSNVTNMVNMFKYCRNLQELNLKSFDTSNVTKTYNMFEECNKIISLDLSNFNTSNITSMSKMFYRLYNVTNINVSTFDTSKVTDMSNMFSQCRILENLDISNFDASSVNYVSSMFYNLPKLIKLKFMSNLGKGYTQKSINYSNYKLDLSLSKNLTHESLMDVINNLYDLNLSYDVANGGTLYTQSLVLGSTNLAKLTAEEIAIATSRGWTVS